MAAPSELHAPAAAPAPPPALEADGLRRAFGPRRAVDGVSFALAPGECLALFGPNGAGKTTTLRMLAGLLSPTAGEARVDGRPIAKDEAVRARVGLISHHAMLYAALTAQENVAFAARLYGVADPEGAARASLERMRVLERADTPVRRLSRGLQQRVSIARAMVHDPRVVLLDEPFTGLDDAGARALTGALTTLKAAGAALVLVTHNLVEGLALATRVAVMRDGAFVLDRPRAAVEDVAFAAEYRALFGVG
ncbi:heme ABC exporter ATP-binding protein CcmA [Roseisolibacter sp. H3M3-2]|uniref:heme ABC exporter ATP-binding protein CcmA n=1 Tax=Roseisolibacter sp. H3M3-2 TaxID=3031323 RepID=UPI0023D9C417|nr:heme ABC exporter ATP-binding protein CcmA [Roseisolibacter sp. H3M3-2]MDF1502448.1 heme ABC exporter ATP-binding protein CcmA [Roseisolibacter sp. H3M3-2]